MAVRRLNHAVLYVHDLASAVEFYTTTALDRSWTYRTAWLRRRTAMAGLLARGCLSGRMRSRPLLIPGVHRPAGPVRRPLARPAAAGQPGPPQRSICRRRWMSRRRRRCEGSSMR